MRYLHTMVRVSNLEQSLDFYCNKLGLKETRRVDHEAGRFTLVFVAAPGQEDCTIELTHNWDPEPYAGGRNFGHVAYEVDDIYARVRTLARGRRHDQSPAARRQDGLHPLTRQHLDRAAAKRRGAAEGRALGLDAEHGIVVTLREIALDDAEVAGLDVVAVGILDHDAVAALALRLVERLVGRLDRAR